MKYFLNSLIITVLIAGCTSIEGIKRTGHAIPGSLPVWSDGLKPDTSKLALRVDIQVKNRDFTGLCILKCVDNELKGTVINEFGAKAFDFVVNDGGCKLLDVNQMLDRSYIRKTIESDFYFLFEADNEKAPFHAKEERFEQDNFLIVNYKKRQIVKEPGGTVTLTNLKYGIKYRFHKIIEIDRSKTVL